MDGSYQGDNYSDAAGAQRLELQGYAKQPEAVRGVWPDQWAGVDVAAMIAPTRDMTVLQIEVWVPPQIDGGQQLRIEFGDAVSTHSVASGDADDHQSAADGRGRPCGSIAHPRGAQLDAKRRWRFGR